MRLTPNPREGVDLLISSVRVLHDGRKPSAATTLDSRMKGCFSDFLKLRHGGSGYMFAWGQGPIGNTPLGYNLPGLPGGGNYTGYPTGSPAMERPFHALSYPDIDFTVMRPAMLPPSPTALAAANPVPLSSVLPPVGTPSATAPVHDGAGMGPRNQEPVPLLYPFLSSTAGVDGFPNSAAILPAGATLPRPPTGCRG